MPKCRVSVIIPTYNRAQLVRNAIESVLMQTYHDFELVIIDDGSTDNTEKAIGRFNDSRLRYLKQPNQGVSAARNAGLQIASGELVAFLDSDDLFMPQKLSTQIELIDNHPHAGLVYSRFYFVAENGQLTTRGRCYSPGDHHFPFGPKIHLSTVLVKRVWLERVDSFDEQLTVAEDAELIWRLNAAGCPMIGVSEPLIVRRKGDNSLASNRHVHIDDMLALVDKIFADPRMPNAYLEQKEFARAKQLVIAAASAYLAGDQVQGRTLLNRAFANSNKMATEEMGRLVNKFNSFLIGHSSGNVTEILQLAVHDLPETEVFQRKVARMMSGHFHLAMAFKEYQAGKLTQCRKHLLQAIKNRPRYVLNRGVLSILIRSLAAKWLTGSLERAPCALEHEELVHVLQTLDTRMPIEDKSH